MMFKGRKTIREEAGAVAIIVALGITAFIGFLALVADIGYLYEVRRQLQSAADAAALAGMSDIIKGGDGVAEARDYADRNDLIEAAVDLDRFDTEAQDEDGDGDIDAFQVTVGKPASLFFASIFNLTSSNVAARARAKRVYLTGTRGLVPLMIPIIRPVAMRAAIERVDTDWPLTQDASGLWSGAYADTAGLPTAGPANQAVTYPVDLTLTNKFGVDQKFVGAPNTGIAAITLHRAGDPIQDARLQANTVGTGEWTYLYITADAEPQVTARGTGVGIDPVEPLGGGEYRVKLTAPAEISDVLEPFAIDIEADGFTNNSAAVLLVRRENSPIKSIEVDNSHWSPGDPAPRMSVQMLTFDYDDPEYIIKYRNGDQAASGNFSALAFDTIEHKWPVFDPTQEHGEGGKGAAALGENLVYFPDIVHIGDKVWTDTGVKQNTIVNYKTGFPKRFAECPCGCLGACSMTSGCTVSSWEAAGRPENCRKLVSMPLVELWDQPTPSGPMTGRTPVIVTAIVEFFVNQVDADANISGRFVDFFKGGETTEEEPDPDLPYIETTRLVKPEPDVP